MHRLKERTSPETGGMAALREELPGLVSVIVPAYNAEKFIEKAISSVTHQSYGNLEVLVVDDGSQDRTAEIVEDIARRDGRVRLIRQKNAGVAAARNRAIAEARGEFVAPIDADDLWHRDKLSLQIATLRSAPARVSVVYCWSLAIDTQDVVLSEKPVPFAADVEGDVLVPMAVQNFVGNGSAPLIRRSAVSEVGGYDEQLKRSEDWKFYIALAERFEFALVRRALVGYRRGPSTLTMDVAGMERSWNVVAKWVRGRHPRLPRSAIVQQTHLGYVYFFQLALRRGLVMRALRCMSIAAVNAPGRFLLVLFRIASDRLNKSAPTENTSFDLVDS